MRTVLLSPPAAAAIAQVREMNLPEVRLIKETLEGLLAGDNFGHSLGPAAPKLFSVVCGRFDLLFKEEADAVVVLGIRPIALNWLPAWKQASE